jgi:hypothetical protein
VPPSPTGSAPTAAMLLLRMAKPCSIWCATFVERSARNRRRRRRAAVGAVEAPPAAPDAVGGEAAGVRASSYPMPTLPNAPSPFLCRHPPGSWSHPDRCGWAAEITTFPGRRKRFSTDPAGRFPASGRQSVLYRRTSPICWQPARAAENVIAQEVWRLFVVARRCVVDDARRRLQAAGHGENEP